MVVRGRSVVLRVSIATGVGGLETAQEVRSHAARTRLAGGLQAAEAHTCAFIPLPNAAADEWITPRPISQHDGSIPSAANNDNLTPRRVVIGLRRLEGGIYFDELDFSKQKAPLKRMMGQPLFFFREP